MEDYYSHRKVVDLIPYIALIGSLLSMLAAAFLTEYQRRLHQPRSQFIFCFSLLVFFTILPRLYGLILSPGNRVLPDIPQSWAMSKLRRNLEAVQLYAMAVYVCTAFSQLLIQCFSLHTRQNSLLHDKNACPELWASVPSLWTFSWMTKTIWKAFRGRVVSPEDVFTVRPVDAVLPNYERFSSAWELSKARLYRDMAKTNALTGTHRRHSRNDDRVALLEEDDDDQMSAQERTQQYSVEFRGVASNSDNTDDKKRKCAQKQGIVWTLLRALSSAFGGRLLLSWLLLLLSTFLSYASPILLGLFLRYLALKDAPISQGYLIAIAMFGIGLVQVLLSERGFYDCRSVGVSVRSALTAAIYRKVAEMEWKDERMKCLGELFGAIKVIKLYAWEKAFSNKASEIRRRELGQLIRVAIGWSVAQVIWNLAPYLILLVTFVTFNWPFLTAHITGHPIHVTNLTSSVPPVLNPERIFVSVSLFNLMRAPLVMLPWCLSQMVMAYVSVKRIASFLLSPEVDADAIERSNLDDKTSDILTFSDASFSWSHTGTIVLKNINLTVRGGALVAIVGTVGSGKSSLLSACLGDLVRRSGVAKLSGTIAYVPQTAWIQQLSLRDNICFNPVSTSSDAAPQPDPIQTDPGRYQSVVSACALEQDIDRLPAGDKTEIGERGVNLSGGQRQRVSLARAVYQDSDIYLLDDPLSAVDAHVAQSLFDEVLGPRGLLRDKTRIVTTNSFKWLNLADCIVVLNEDGEMVQSGSYQQIVSNTKGHFNKYLQTLEHHAKKSRIQRERASVQLVNAPTMRRNTAADTGKTRRTSESATRSVRTSMAGLVHDLARSPPHGSGVPKRVSISVSEHEFTSSLERDLCMHLDRDAEFNRGGLRRRSQIPYPDTLSVPHGAISDVLSESDSESASSQSPVAGTGAAAADLTATVTGQFVTDEAMTQGRVHWSTYGKYILARGWLLSFVTILAYATFLGVQTFANIWLQWFADDADLISAERDLKNQTIFDNSTQRNILIDQIARTTFYYISGYTYAGLSQTLLIFVYVGSHMAASLRASKVIHRSLLSHILRAPAAFFDQTPLGRILNRFSNDIDNLDHQIPDAVLEVIACLGDTIVALLVLVIALRPAGLGLALVGPMVVACFILQMLYMPCARQARRLESITRSPLLANFGETAASSLGVTVVRAFDRTASFTEIADRLVDRNSVQSFVRFASNRWLDVYLNLLTRLVLLVTTILIVQLRAQISAGLAGLLITYAMETAENFTLLVKQTSQMESSAVSLERIREYTQIKQEASWEEGPGGPPPPDWPRPCCEVVFNRTTVTYDGTLSTAPVDSDNQETETADTKPLLGDDLVPSTVNETTMTPSVTALHSIDLTLSGHPQRRRIGIVGRTGAGKSSLAASLFRLIEPVVTDEDRRLLPLERAHLGPILVDGVDVTRIGLHEVRSRFSILPQEPVLFSGTLRFNLDPFSARTDTELCEALSAAHLTNWMESDGISLEYECGEGGCNLSAGQRQLICLARVFLSSAGRVRLLILDEATAAMDPVTDRLVMQTVIGDQFKDATVIIIAHRISTVIDTDLIVVLDDGRVVETGRPSDLLADPNSRFAAMHQTGQ